jgi:serine/threonine protein kinase/Flp pilus assembly protein TadD
MDPTPSGTVVTGWTMPAGAPTVAPALHPGSIVGGRYEILAMLGEGGMGAVYKAMDHELDRVLALKVIRPQYAKQAAVLKRFKRELVLARQITHRNVIRIFDLGVADGIRFITMEYVEGQELSDLVEKRGKLPPDEAAGLIEQICHGLRVAHAEGVVHRDLKPANVMVDSQGRAVIMDFGIARALDTATLTNTGALVGTPVYMSPEQAKGESLDARSDLFTLGIIFYELLTGSVPFKADNMMTMLLKRCQEDAQPPIEVEPSIPPRLNEIVMKALARDPAQRYQSAQEFLSALEAYRAPAAPPVQPPARNLKQAWLAVAGGLLLGIAAVFGYFKLHSGPPPVHKEVTVLVADFDNTTSESVFDGALEPVIMTGLEGASFVTMFSRPAAHQIAQELKPGATKINETLARLIAKREGINVVFTGLVARAGDGYRVTINALDGDTGKGIVSKDSASVQKDAILKETAKLLPALRRALGDVTPENQLMAASETFSSSSLDAVHDYGTAQQSLWAGKYDDAIAQYFAALKADPQFGRAYAGIATASYNLGRMADTDKYFKLAMAQVGRMSEREKHRTLGGYFINNRDYTKAIEESTALVNQFPYDTAGEANLAFGYCLARDMAKAVQHGKQAVDIHPNNVTQRNNYALFSLFAGDTATALSQTKIVLERNPSYPKGFLVTALAQEVEGKVDAALSTYGQMEKVSPRAASMALTGMADLAMYQGRFSDAASMLEKPAEYDGKNPQGDSAVAKVLIQAEARLAQGSAAPAAQLAEKAMTLSDQDAVLVVAAQILGKTHQEEKAQKLAVQLGDRLTAEPRAWSKVVAGEMLLSHAKYTEAIQTLNEAPKLTDLWMAHYDLGRAYVEAGAYAQALSEMEICLKRRGESASVFIVDEFPTIRYLPAVYYYTARAQQGLGSPRAAESYQTFLAMKEKSQNDPLVTDAKARMASLGK